MSGCIYPCVAYATLGRKPRKQSASSLPSPLEQNDNKAKSAMRASDVLPPIGGADVPRTGEAESMHGDIRLSDSRRRNATADAVARSERGWTIRCSKVELGPKSPLPVPYYNYNI
eukprot:2577949-Amphidinium_carterae.1